MIFQPLSLAGAYTVSLERLEDERGFFARIFCGREFEAQGLETCWAQMNTSYSRHAGTVRGLHFQRPPKAEVKFIRCVRGAVWDVIVDLRAGSDQFGQWTAVELNETNRDAIYVPKGFAHGFQVLKPDTELIYFHSEFYSPEHEGGVHHADPALNIPWPLPPAHLTAKDQAHPPFEQIKPVTL